LPIEQIGCDASKSYHAEDSCYPLEKSSESAWTLNQVFGRPIKGNCPITGETAPDSTTICLNVPLERTIDIETEPPNTPVIKEIHEDGSLTCFKPPPETHLDIVLAEQDLSSIAPLTTPRLHAFRSITGYGQEHGVIQATIVNPSTESLDVLYLESLPWYMKPYLHTLRSSLNPPSNVTTIKETFYRPALDRHRGTHLELQLTIPPQSTLSLTYDFEKAILRYTEYPPDANRGFDVAPAVIRVLAGPNDTDPETLRRGIYIRTTSLLLPLPTPDFSMPYNVIILTSTVMALGFGSIFNLLVRRFVSADEIPVTPIGIALKAIASRFRARTKAFVGRIKGTREKTE
jgi:GPI-anchor transamidase subunit T